MICNALNTQIRNNVGVNSFHNIKPVIVNGENLAIKHLVQFGSNELIDAILPVPKNDKNKYRIYANQRVKGKYYV